MASSDISLVQLVSSRRTLLRGTGVASLSAVAVSLLAGCQTSIADKKGADPGGDVGMLNTALGLEYQAIAAYQVGAESGLLQKPVLDLAVQFQGDHKKHAEILNSTISKM